MATGDGRKSPANFARLQSNRVCDWTEHDCGVRLLLCVQRTVSAQLFRVAHSLGGLLFGGAPNGAELAGFVFVSTHTGYCGDYRRQNRIPMAIVRHAWMPLVTRIVGYFPCFDLDGARICQRELQLVTLRFSDARRTRCFGQE
jgi:predicted alpha/beta hydrolase